MSFAFGFSGDDIEDDNDEVMHDAEADIPKPTQQPAGPSAKAVSHRVEDLLATLPDKISFSKLEMESPKGRKLLIPRRELFDVRLQLMAEDEANSAQPAVGLDATDIQTNVYEGGYKTWECSIDLARLLLDRGPRKDLDDLCRVDHVVEMGCGTAIPTLVLFHYAVTEGLPIYFTLSDYNAAVLRLVTIPNMILTWASTLPATYAPFTLDDPNPLLNQENGDLYITAELKQKFLDAMVAQGLTLNFISGSWTPSAPFLSYIPTAPEMNILVLASETIYSPNALASFTEALIGILQQVRMGKSMIAAKRVYFGVGGSVDAFKVECRERKAVAYEIDNHGVDLSENSGVRRCLLEVQML